MQIKKCIMLSLLVVLFSPREIHANLGEETQDDLSLEASGLKDSGLQGSVQQGLTIDPSNCYCLFSTSPCSCNGGSTEEGWCVMPSSYLDCYELAQVFSWSDLRLDYTINIVVQTAGEGSWYSSYSGLYSCGYQISCPIIIGEEDASKTLQDVDAPVSKGAQADAVVFGNDINDCYCTFTSAADAPYSTGYCASPGAQYFDGPDCRAVAQSLNEVSWAREYYYSITSESRDYSTRQYVCWYQVIPGYPYKEGDVLARALGIGPDQSWYQSARVQACIWTCFCLLLGCFGLKVMLKCRRYLECSDEQSYEKIGATFHSSSEYVSLNYQS